MIISKYDTSTGEIQGLLSVPDEASADLNVSSGFAWLLWPYDAEDVKLYKVNVGVQPNVIVLKTTQSLAVSTSSITANGTDSSTISVIEKNSNAVLSIDEEEYRATALYGTKMKFCTDQVGTHNIVFSHPAWLDTTVTITATAP